MAFGQQAGPPSSAKQVAEITELLEQAGYSSLREARHPFDLTQRQANGKFTRDEAAELIDRLVAATETDPGTDPGTAPGAAAGTGPAAPTTVPAERSSRRQADRQAEVVAALPDEVLADELVRRGWMCMPPS